MWPSEASRKLLKEKYIHQRYFVTKNDGEYIKRKHFFMRRAKLKPPKFLKPNPHKLLGLHKVSPNLITNFFCIKKNSFITFRAPPIELRERIMLAGKGKQDMT